MAAGNFVAAGKVAAQYVARFSPATGEWSAMGAGLSAVPVAAAVTPDGRVVVACNKFAPALGYNVGFVSVWDSAGGGGAWQQMGPDFDHSIFALTALPNGDVIAGGDFHAPGDFIARWEAESLSWYPMPASGGPAAPVYALAVEAGGDLLAAAYGGTQGRVHRFVGGAWIQVGGLANGVISGLAVEPAGGIVAVGNFTSFGTSATRVARWNGAAWTNLGSGADYAVYSVAVLPGGDVVIGGEFATVGGADARRVARWNGAAWSSPLPPGSEPMVGSVDVLRTLSSGDVIAAGGFGFIGKTSAANIARLRSGGAGDGSWAPVGEGWNGSVNALLALANGDVLVGGPFNATGEPSTFGIGRRRAATGRVEATGAMSSFAAIPYTISQAGDGTLFLGGSMSTATGGIANGLVKWDGSAWAPIGAGTSGGSFNTVYTSLSIANGDVVIGGMFGAVNGVTAPLIARWNGSVWSSIGGGLSGTSGASVYSLAQLPNGDLIVGGRFSLAGGPGGVAVTNIARWNGTAWSALGSGLTPQSVKSLAVLPGGDIIAGGTFTASGATPVARLARWNGAGWSTYAGGVAGTGNNVGVNALSVQADGSVVVGGLFSTVGGGEVQHSLARWDGAAWHGYGGVDGGAVFAIARVADGLLVGGSFTAAGGATSYSLARWSNGVVRCGPADMGGQGGVAAACGDGLLDNNDFVVFIDAFFARDASADHGRQGGEPGADGEWDNNDFVVFIDEFFAGC